MREYSFPLLVLCPEFYARPGELSILILTEPETYGLQAGSLKLGSAGSGTLRSRSQPSFSSLMD